MHRTRALLPLVLVLSASACGLPTGGAPETIAPSDVPYGLTSATPTRTREDTAPPRPDAPRIYLVTADELLVPRGRAITPGTPAERLDRVVDELAAGPNRAELGDELSTALPPEVRLSVSAVDAGTATIDISASQDAPSELESRRAVGQIVLTATSVPSIDTILLTRDGLPVEAPLPSGELTSEPLTAQDYAVLLESPPP